MTIDRRTLLRGSAAMAAAGALIGPFGARSAAVRASVTVVLPEPERGAPTISPRRFM